MFRNKKIIIIIMNININNVLHSNLLNTSALSKDNLTFLPDILSGSTKSFRIQRLDNLINISLILEFLHELEPDNGYILQPFLDSLSSDTKNSPILSISTQFLISRESNPLIIRDFLTNQIQIAIENYGIEKSEGDLILKFRPLILR